MTTVKAYTNIEQSKKLTEILPIESADMVYIKHATSDNLEFRFDDDMPPMVLKNVPISEITADTLPCWSLVALFDSIPKHIKDYNVLRIDIGENDFSIWYDEVGYGVNEELPNITMECPVDACVAMIEKLDELKML